MDPLTRQVTRHAPTQLTSLCKGLDGGDWAGFLRDWDRSLRAANHPETTRYNYLLAAAQLARYLADHPNRTYDGRPRRRTRPR